MHKILSLQQKPVKYITWFDIKRKQMKSKFWINRYRFISIVLCFNMRHFPQTTYGWLSLKLVVPWGVVETSAGSRSLGNVSGKWFPHSCLSFSASHLPWKEKFYCTKPCLKFSCHSPFRVCVASTSWKHWDQVPKPIFSGEQSVPLSSCHSYEHWFTDD